MAGVSTTSPVHPQVPTKSHRRTLSAMDAWRTGRSGSGMFPEDDWFETPLGERSDASGSDSAYATLDEDSEEGPERLERKVSLKGRPKKQRHTRSSSVGNETTRTRTLFLQADYPRNKARDSICSLASDSSLDDSSDSSSVSPSTGPTPPLSLSSASTPEPSECDFDLGLTEATFSPVRRSNQCSPPGLFDYSIARRHTLPRRKRVRGPSISFSLVPPALLEPVIDVPPFSSPPHSLEIVEPLPSLTLLASSATLTLSILSYTSPFALLHASPVHLLQSPPHSFVEYANALLSPFLVTFSASAIALGVANLASLKTLEDGSCRLRTTTKVATASAVWASILGCRILLAWVFGRVLGWAHPGIFSTSAIHEVGAGLAPLLLSLHLLRSFRTPTRKTSEEISAFSTSSPSSPMFQIALLAANFVTPIAQGGTGMWWGISGVIVGLLACLTSFVSDSIATNLRPSPLSSSQRQKSFGPLLLLVLLPLLTTFSSLPPSTQDLSQTFGNLHPQHPHLLSVLLMTAPRPGNPGFLVETIDSWLSAFPDPRTSAVRGLSRGLISSSSANSSVLPQALDPTSRVRLIVYTHFKNHDVFDEAQRHFTSSPVHAAKVAKYVTWHRDPRATSNRLDQRLHVARGLDYAAKDGGDSAYVLLAEDDFPLCPGGGGSKLEQWSNAWEELMRVFVATNEAMPDLPSSDATLTNGHCGIFIATGGSGLAIRGTIAKTLPALLLGAEDPHGVGREARAERGEFSIKSQDQGADTPDLVIQDCLRGRIAGCEVCAPPPPTRSSSPWPTGSLRSPKNTLGDRWGKSGLVGTERLLQHHLGYNASTLPGRKYGKEEWACGWRQPFNGEADVLTV